MAGLLALLSVSACDIPTEAPYWESRWIVPAQTTEIALNEFLPAGVTVAPDGSTFLISFGGFSGGQSLDDLCGAPCSAFNGSTVPKPGFAETFPIPGNMPAQFVSAELAEGRLEIELTNGFSFDPIRPGGEPGELTVRIFNVWQDSAAEEVGAFTIDGEDESFPSGSSVIREVVLVPGPISPALRAEIFLHSPAGDPVVIDTSEAFGARFDVLMLRVSSVEVDVSGRQVRLEEVALDLEDVDEEMVERVKAGGVNLEVENPFGVGLELNFRIDGPGISPVEKTMSISSAETSSSSISMTEEELRSFLGQPGVTLSGEAVVSPTASVVTLRPGQVFSVDTQVDVSVHMGGGT